MSEIVTLPKWKKNATAYDRLSELALLAREQPDKFDKFALVYQELMPNGNVKPRTLCYSRKNDEAMDYTERMGLFEVGKLKTWEDSK